MIGALLVANLGAAQRDLEALLASDMVDLEAFHPAVQLTNATLACLDKDGQWGDEVGRHEYGSELHRLDEEFGPVADTLLDGPAEWREPMRRVADGLAEFFKNNLAAVVSLETSNSADA